MAAHSPLTEFALLARVPDDMLDLERLAGSIARMRDPAVDPAAISATLDALAARIADAVSPSAPPDVLAAQLLQAIGGTLGFAGTPDVFASADGSFLDQVLARRQGLPILLAVVWMALGRRLGVPVVGVGYPGHFLACLDLPGARIYFDPFAGGTVLDAGVLLDRLPEGADRALLDPAPVRAIVTRMLVNLKHLWVGRHALDLAMGAVDRILLVGGEVAPEVRDRGLLCLHLGRTQDGVRDLRRYLVLAPTAGDRAEIERLLATHRDT